ncbi:fibronectin type III domain-containing protein, partial [Paenibacillus sp. EPM92]|uniref:fibronectin type III domain-containing protein n=1 Tax=Paenibacillus sp. EPM92 TaxID=1561195 RepID=UPI0019152988
HYKNMNGTWEEIDNNIYQYENSEYSMGTRGNRFYVLFKGTIPEVEFLEKKYSINYIPLDTNRNIKSNVEGNKINYKDVWQNTDVSYSVTNDGLKMNILLKNVDSPKQFIFEIDTKNLTPVLKDDQSIVLIDENNNIVASIPTPWIMDKNSRTPNYDRIKVELKEINNKTLIIISLNDNGLTYPVLIDPTTYSFETNFQTDRITNKLNLNIPDILAGNITYAYFDNYFIPHTDDPEDVAPQYPMDIFITKTDSEGINLNNPTVSPTQDGTNSIKIGRTSYPFYDENTVISYVSTDEENLFGQLNPTELVKGIAFWSNTPHNYWDLNGTVTLIYNDAPLSTPIAPKAPQLSVGNIGSTRVTLTWTAASPEEGVTKYEVYQVPYEYQNTPIFTPYSNSIDVFSLLPGKNYEFYVRAVTSTGLVSDKSNTVVVKTLYDKAKYYYDSNNRLDYIEFGSENDIVDYIYDSNGNLLQIVIIE